jgi:hypothetical protein
MSLKSFIAIPEIRSRFSEEFARPDFNVTLPMLAPPKSKRYSLVGTAFDYLFRFMMQSLNPNAISGHWLAEYWPFFLDCIDEEEEYDGVNAIIAAAIKKDPFARKCHAILLEGKECHKKYIDTGRMEKAIIESSIRLAQIDGFVRSKGFEDPDLGKVREEDVRDLRRLISLVDPKQFVAKKRCVLNPTFKNASKLVAGADADLLIDGMLIDIKTTKYLKLDREYINQLIGYYILSRIGGIDNVPRKHQRRIDTLAIYYSRYGFLFKFPVRNIAAQKRWQPVIRWFTLKARKMYPGAEDLPALANIMD